MEKLFDIFLPTSQKIAKNIRRKFVEAYGSQLENVSISCKNGKVVNTNYFKGYQAQLILQFPNTESLEKFCHFLFWNKRFANCSYDSYKVISNNCLFMVIIMPK